MNRKTVMLVLAAVLAAVVLSSSSSAQVTGNAECVLAKTWHLQQAMKVSLVSQQEYHVNAAAAADELSTMGAQPCAGWKEWANGSSGPVLA